MIRYFAPCAAVLALTSLLPGCSSGAGDAGGVSAMDGSAIADPAVAGDPTKARSSVTAALCPTSADVVGAKRVNGFALDDVHQPPAATAKFVYAANQNSHDVSTYAIDPSGSLRAVGAPIAVGRYPDSVALLPNGAGLFIANRGSDSVSGFKVDPATGALTEAGAAIVTAAGPTAILADPSGRFVYVGSDDASLQTPDLITTYRVDATSAGLSAVEASHTDGAGLLAMSIDPFGRFLYTANALSDDISVLSLDPCSGVASKVGANVASAFPVSLAVDPSGRFLYVAAGGSDPSLQTFRIDSSSGALQQIDELKGVSLPWGLKALQLDRTGQFLFVVAVGRASASSMSTYSIDPQTGFPSAVSRSSVSAGTNADPVAIDQSGRFAYVGNFGSNDISAYSLDRSTGAFTAIGTFPAGTAPGALAISSAQP